MSFFKLYLSSFMFLRKLLSFQVVRNSVIEIQIIKKTDNHSQDSAMSSSWTILKMGFYFIKAKLYLHQYCSRGWSIITSLKKLPFFDPPNSHHHVSLRMICHVWHRYPSFIIDFSFLKLKKNQWCATTHDTSSHVFK